MLRLHIASSVYHHVQKKGSIDYMPCMCIVYKKGEQNRAKDIHMQDIFYFSFTKLLNTCP